VPSESDPVDDIPLFLVDLPELFTHVGNDGVHSRVGIVHLRSYSQYNLAISYDHYFDRYALSQRDHNISGSLLYLMHPAFKNDCKTITRRFVNPYLESNV
jgi:hypothetical protein